MAQIEAEETMQAQQAQQVVRCLTIDWLVDWLEWWLLVPGWSSIQTMVTKKKLYARKEK